MLSFKGKFIKAHDEVTKAYELIIQENKKNNSEPHEIFKKHLKRINAEFYQHRIELLQNLINRHKYGITFGLDFDELKDTYDDNPKLLKQIEILEESTILEHNEIAWKASDCLNLKRFIKSSYKFKQKFLSYKQDVNRFQIESNEKILFIWWSQKENVENTYTAEANEEIYGNIKLTKYYETLCEKIYNAYREAQIIAYKENIDIKAKIDSFSVLSQAINIIPDVKDLITLDTGLTPWYINPHFMKQAAEAFLKKLALFPDVLKKVVNKIAESATLNNRSKLENIENDTEVDYWINKGRIFELKDFFKIDLEEDMLNRRKPEILGYIDALKIFFKILKTESVINMTSEEIVNWIAEVTTPKQFLTQKIVSPKSSEKACCIVY